MLPSIYMCGRYSITGAKFYIAQQSRTYKPDRIELARWGFWPEEWKRSTRVRPQINARLETAAEKPMFAPSFRGRHCLFLVDGYYEWCTVGTRKPISAVNGNVRPEEQRT